MVGLDDLIESKVLAGVAIAAGVAILAPVVLPVIVGVARPLVKSAIKTGIVLYERGVEAVSEVGEIVEDLVAEAKAELQPAAPESGLSGMPAGTSGESPSTSP